MPQLTEDIARKAMSTFMEKWNNGDIEAACEVYIDDAELLAHGNYYRGREQIIAQYRRSYVDRQAMGKLTLTMLSFRIDATEKPQMAIAVLRWHLDYANGSQDEGYCLETYVLENGEIRIAQDASV